MSISFVAWKSVDLDSIVFWNGRRKLPIDNELQLYLRELVNWATSNRNQRPNVSGSWHVAHTVMPEGESHIISAVPYILSHTTSLLIPMILSAMSGCQRVEECEVKQRGESLGSYLVSSELISYRTIPPVLTC
jgi:hypothetical protein